MRYTIVLLQYIFYVWFCNGNDEPCHYNVKPNGGTTTLRFSDFCTRLSFIAEGKGRLLMRFTNFFVGYHAICHVFDEVNMGAQPIATFSGDYPLGLTDTVATTSHLLHGVCEQLTPGFIDHFNLIVNTLNSTCRKKILMADSVPVTKLMPGPNKVLQQDEYLCEWQISASPPAAVGLNFYVFDTEPDDIVTVYDGTIRDSNKRLLFFSGYNLVKNMSGIVSTEHSILVRFYFNAGGNTRRYAFDYFEFEYTTSIECSLTQISVIVGTQGLRDLDFHEKVDSLIVSRAAQNVWHSVPHHCRPTSVTPTEVKFNFSPSQCDNLVRFNYTSHSAELHFVVRRLGEKLNNKISMVCDVNHPKISVQLQDNPQIPLLVELQTSAQEDHAIDQARAASIVAGEFIYVRCQADSAFNSYQLHVNSCFAADRKDSYSKRKVKLVSNGCAVNRLFSTKLLESNVTSSVNLRFRSFYWSSETIEPKSVHLQCSFFLCLKNKRCLPGCFVGRSIRQAANSIQERGENKTSVEQLSNNDLAVNCTVNGATCEHLCVKKNQEFRCSCEKGYVLSINGHSCLKTVHDSDTAINMKNRINLAIFCFCLVVSCFVLVGLAVLLIRRHRNTKNFQRL